MKAYDIIGWTFDGAMYCADHKPAVPEDKQDAGSLVSLAKREFGTIHFS